MSSGTKQWLIVLAFFLGFFAFTFLEAAWVNRRVAGGFPRALLLAFTSNMLTVTVGFSVSLVIFGVIFGLGWDRSLETLEPNMALLWTAFIAAAIFPLGLLILAKRLLLRVLKLTGLANPLAYSLVASALFLVSTIGLPIAIAYFL